jgi:hypothetical protein
MSALEHDEHIGTVVAEFIHLLDDAMNLSIASIPTSQMISSFLGWEEITDLKYDLWKLR